MIFPAPACDDDGRCSEMTVPPEHCVLIKSWLFPWLTFGCGMSAFIIGYIVGVANDHEEAWFSMISDGGAIPPESCIFGLLLNHAAFFWALTCVSRHIQLHTQLKLNHRSRRKLRVYVNTMLFVGMLGGLGMSLVSNFQEGASPRIMHTIGAQTCFFCGILYIILYFVLERLARQKFVTRRLTVIRLILLAVVGVSLTLYRLCLSDLGLFVDAVDGVKPSRPPKPNNGIRRLKKDHPYYWNNLIACISEWVMVLTYFAFIPTYASELSAFEVRPVLRLAPTQSASVSESHVPEKSTV